MAAPVVPNLVAYKISDSHQRHHIRAVHHHLQSQGILKISLGFSDERSQYLENLVMGLRAYHGHGPPITHSASRGWFWDVRPGKNTCLPQNDRARSETMQEFPWHTDCSYEDSPPRYFALQVLRPDRCGGGTLSVLKVDQLTRFLSSSAKAALCEPEFQIKIPPEFIKQPNERHIMGSILGINEQDQSTIMRFREDIVTPMSNRATSALEALKRVLEDSELSSKATLHLKAADLPERSIILLDNRRWLHARNSVKDPSRHLRRVRWNAVPFSRGQISDELGE
ncbi:hypothetical protein PENFLA_c003G06793 [Penicillium flavigenum]|uniref:Uncharacterized protein n=1 Tax=Penicillium flavigenum TaxID=254877 RepID=A0A1V6TXM1_9EURO|nr:hypothetical protein PENFLA_c003G06793 [Penicillium flavigenum]